MSHSRRRPASKGEITEPTERISQNPVTGEIERTVLNAVQKAFEKFRRSLETAAWMNQLTAPERERLADMVMLMVMQTKRHTDADLDALRDLLGAMNAQGRTPPAPPPECSPGSE